MGGKFPLIMMHNGITVRETAVRESIVLKA